MTIAELEAKWRDAIRAEHDAARAYSSATDKFRGGDDLGAEWDAARRDVDRAHIAWCEAVESRREEVGR